MKLKKADLLLILICLGTALAAFGVMQAAKGGNRGKQAVIYVGNQEYGRYDLNQECDMVVSGKKGGTNQVVIRDGSVSVIAATCPDRICMHQGEIRKIGETIVCMPNQVLVTIESEKTPD